MSLFICARCAAYADADDGCDESPGGRLICVDCVDAMDDDEGEQVRSEAEPGHTPAQTNKGEG